MKSVYAIAGTDGRIKVGVSNNPTQRMEGDELIDPTHWMPLPEPPV